MTSAKLVFRFHAIQRMFERGISKKDVRQIIAEGQTIENYPKDTPYPSRLVLGWLEGRPLHTVVADDVEGRQTIVITVYEPDPSKWEPDFRARKKP